jgi:hypothetical protein
LLFRHVFALLCLAVPARASLVINVGFVFTHTCPFPPPGATAGAEALVVTGAGEDIGAAACFDRRCLVGLGLCAAEASAGVAPAFTAAGVPVVATSDFLCLWCLSGLGDGEASGVVDCAKVLAAKAATVNVMMRERI